MNETAVPWGYGASSFGGDGGLLLAEEAVRRERGAPAGTGVSGCGARPRGNHAAALRQRIDAHAGGVLAPRGVLVPAALAEGEQHGGIGDAGAVVGDGDADGGGSVGDGLGDDVEPRGAATAGILNHFRERIGEIRGKESGDAVDGAVVDARPDRGGELGTIGHGVISRVAVGRIAPRRSGRRGASRWDGAAARPCAVSGAGRPGYPARRRRRRGRCRGRCQAPPAPADRRRERPRRSRRRPRPPCG